MTAESQVRLTPGGVPRPGRFTATILVVDDHPAICGWLRGVLEPAGYVVLDAPSGEAALTLAEQHALDMAILDILMPHAQIEGIAAARTLWFDHAVPCLLLTGVTQAAMRLAAQYAGAHGYILKETTNPAHMLEAVRAVLTHQPVPDTLNRMQVTAEEKALLHAQTAARQRALALLTPQQQRVARMIQAGKTNPQIADDLCVTVSTVNAHVSHILERLDLATRHEVRTRVLFDSDWDAQPP